MFLNISYLLFFLSASEKCFLISCHFRRGNTLTNSSSMPRYARVRCFMGTKRHQIQDYSAHRIHFNIAGGHKQICLIHRKLSQATLPEMATPVLTEVDHAAVSTRNPSKPPSRASGLETFQNNLVLGMPLVFLYLRFIRQSTASP